MTSDSAPAAAAAAIGLSSPGVGGGCSSGCVVLTWGRDWLKCAALRRGRPVTVAQVEGAPLPSVESTSAGQVVNDELG
jgi:hypothetical protein